MEECGGVSEVASSTRTRTRQALMCGSALSKCEGVRYSGRNSVNGSPQA